MSTPDAASTVQPWPGLLQWHSELHRRWARCSLQFWLLRFGEMYDREAKFDQLVEFMEGEDIGSYAAYELSGEFDILLRLWVPAAEAGGFADRLEKEFDPVDSREFTAVEVVRHWPWRGEVGEEPEPCDAEKLARTTSIEDVTAVNRVSDETHRGELALPSENEAPVLERLMAAHAVTDMQSTTGIRIIIRLKVKERLDNEDSIRLTNHVATLLDGITRPKGGDYKATPGHFIVDEVSVYRCKDRSLLVLCRVPYEGWHSLREGLLEPLGNMQGVLQTTTFAALSRNLVRSRDRLLLDDQAAEALSGGDGGQGAAGAGDRSPKVPPPPVTGSGASPRLDRSEGAEFEVKGSAFTMLERWLGRAADAADDAHLKESSGFFRDSVAKTVVAMLNSEGGSMVLGALEPEKMREKENELLKLRVSKLPRVGEYAVVGLQDPTFLKGGWDAFQLKFNRLLKECVEGEVADLVRLSRDWIAGETVAVVEIEYPGMEDGFFLRDGKEQRFLVRRGGSTDELHGPAIQRYIKRRIKKEGSQDDSG